VFGVAFSPDGHLLAIAGDTTVRVWDADSGERVGGDPFSGHTDRVAGVALIPTGTCLSVVT